MRKLGSAGAVVCGPRGSVDADGTEARKGGKEVKRNGLVTSDEKG